MWQTTSNQGDNRAANEFAGGVNNGTPSLYISDNQSSDEYGFDTFDFPAASVGKGWTAYGSSGAAETNMLANYQNSYLVRAVGTKMQRDASGTWTDITGATGLTDTFWDNTNFNTKILMTNGTDNVKSWDGTTFADLNATDAPKGKYICNDTIRVFIANVGTNTDWVYFSKYLDETNWTDVDSSGFFQYYTPNGGEITGLFLYQNMVIVFKKDSFAEIIMTGNNSNKYRLAPISSQVGTVSNRTIQEVGGILFFLSLTDVWMFVGGQPTPIGLNVKAVIDNINTSQYNKCWSATDGQRYYLGVVTGTNTEVDTLLVYDTKFKIWRVRSKSIPSMRCAATIGNQWYTGDDSGQTFQMNAGTTENGSDIQWSVTSKTFTEGVQEAEKEYFEMHVQYYLPTGSTASLSIATDDRSSTFAAIDDLTTGTSAANQNDIVPLDTVPITNFMRYKLSGTGPFTMYQAQRNFRIQPVQI